MDIVPKLSLETGFVIFWIQTTSTKAKSAKSQCGRNTSRKTVSMKYLGCDLETLFIKTKHITRKCKTAMFNLYKLRQIRDV